jgi:hypothetical protein
LNRNHAVVVEEQNRGPVGIGRIEQAGVRRAVNFL